MREIVRDLRCALAAAGLAGSLLILTEFASSAYAAPVSTESGVVEGVEENAVEAFKGIPFAAPPVGDLRWRAPQAPSAWSGIRLADHFSPICVQHGSYPEDAPPEPNSEDCLYLNVWVPPHEAGATLPVMVWIYGGGLMNGSASTPLYAGDGLARKGVIVVTVNYRLGVLGFLAHPDLSRESPQHVSGNYGLLDQLAALQWVHRNIAAFSGDPSHVTVFGQSSGSISISELVASPLSKGLFQRAIGESGGLFEPVELGADYKLADAEMSGAEFGAMAGASTLQALRAMPAEELIHTHFNPHAIVDGYVLPRAPYDAYREGKQNDVDLLVGSNANEGRAFLDEPAITVANFTQRLDRDFSHLIVSLAGPGPATDDRQARALYISFEGEMRFGWDMWAWARLQADAGKRRVFFYRFTQSSPYQSGDKYFEWGASHGMEMPYVFDHLDQQHLPWTAQDHQLANTIAGYWTNFAKSGDPNGEGLPKWPEFTESNREAMHLGATLDAHMVADESDLSRIGRLYSVARFVARHAYALVAALALIALGILVGLIRFVLRRFQRRTKRVLGNG